MYDIVEYHRLKVVLRVICFYKQCHKCQKCQKKNTIDKTCNPCCTCKKKVEDELIDSGYFKKNITNNNFVL